MYISSCQAVEEVMAEVATVEIEDLAVQNQ